MSLFKYLLFSLLLCSFGIHASGNISPECNSLEATYEIKSEGNNRFEVIVTVKGAVNDKAVQYLFYSSDGKILSDDLTKSSIQHILKGKYYCIVRDGNNCRMTIEIEIN